MAAPTTLIEDVEQTITIAADTIAQVTSDLAVRSEIQAARFKVDPTDGLSELTTTVLWWDDVTAVHDPADGSPGTNYQAQSLGERVLLTDFAIEDTKNALATLEGEIATREAERAIAATPADRDAIDGELDDLELEHRRLLARSQELDRYRSVLATEEANLVARLADAQATLAAAEDEKHRLVATAATQGMWKTAVLTGAASSVKDDANAALTGADIEFVDRELDTLFDNAKDLLAHARNRHARLHAERATLAEQVTDIRSEQDDVLAADMPLQHALAVAERAYAHAALALQSGALEAPLSLEAATSSVAAMRAAIQAHLDGDALLLTSSQLSAIKRSQTVTSATEGAALEVARDAAYDTLVAASHEYQTAKLDKLTTDPDDDLSSIADKATAASDARTAFNTAQSDYASSTKKRTLDKWERSVPVSFWELYRNYLNAVARMEALVVADPADQAANVEAAESALAQARFDARQSQRAHVLAADDVALASTELAALLATGAGYETARLRGDD